MLTIPTKIPQTFVFLFFWAVLVVSCGGSDPDDPEPPLAEPEPLGTIRYKETVFPEVKFSEDVKYGQSTTQGGNTEDRLMDIYEPEGDTLAARPLLVYAHAGGFVFGDKVEVRPLAEFFARSGYVVASIDYRLLDIDRNSLTTALAVLDAVHDMKAAVRYFRKDAETVGTYRIDTSNIFIAGYSAGAITALHYAYLSTEAELSDFGGDILVAYLNTKGGFEGNSGNAGYSSAVKGVINMSGALFSADFVSEGEPSLYSIHGTADEVVPYLEGESDGSGITTEGSGLIHPVAENVGLRHTLKAIQGGDHNAIQSCSSCFSEIRDFLFEGL